jgi:Skp family chaperone for outer membrane proteins
MSIRKFVLIAGMGFGLANLSGAAFAQKTMVVDEDAAFRSSKIGAAISNQIGAISSKGAEQLGLKTLADQIKADEAAMPELKTLTPEAVNANPTLKARVDALSKKLGEFQQKQNALGKAVDQQQNAATVMFFYALNKAIEDVVKTEKVDIVLSAQSTRYFGKAQDLTPKIIARLDATVPNLETLQAMMPKPPADAKAPAAPATKPPG